MNISEMRQAMLSAASSLAERDAREVADAIAHGTVGPDTPPLTRATVHMLADVLHAEALWAERESAKTDPEKARSATMPVIGYAPSGVLAPIGPVPEADVDDGEIGSAHAPGDPDDVDMIAATLKRPKGRR